MKRVICTLTLALILALTSPLGLLADTDVADRPSNGNDNAAQSRTTTSTDNAGNLLDSIVDAVSDLLGHESADPEEPLNDVHPPDWNPPTEGPEGDEDGWDEHK